jgi:hypothetical protein
MADSSFDPLGLVKAMGPQRDPYSWAELYAADASKGEHLREQFKNNLLLQEMQRAERAKEGALTRASHEKIAGAGQTGAMERLMKAAELGRFGSRAANKPNIIFPSESMDAKDFNTSKALRRVDPKKYTLINAGGHDYHIPNEKIQEFIKNNPGGGIAIRGPSATTPATPVEPAAATPAAPLSRSEYEEFGLD